MTLQRLALCVVAFAAAVGLGLLAAQQWVAGQRTHLGTTLRRTEQRLDLAPRILESADRLWPPRGEAAFERARVALRTGDIEGAADWLARSEGRTPSRVRWEQLAANVAHAQGDLEAEERHLGLSLRLDPKAAAADWAGLVALRERIGAPDAAIRDARLRWQAFGQGAPESR
jgi:tetratricopeptide (TPR) repeat protein